MKKIGLVVMFKISEAGGAPSVIVNAIRAMNKMDIEVHLLTPFEVNYEKIEKLYGKIKLEKIYFPKGVKKVICQTNFLPRKFMKEEFIDMTNSVDVVIDIDGGHMHNFLSEGNDSKYIIWRFSCVNLYAESDWSLSRKIIEKIKTALGARTLTIPSNNHKIYSVDAWTAGEMKKYYNLKVEDIYLYPIIRVEEFFVGEKKKRIAIFGRISPHKLIEDSIKIFASGTKEHEDYELVIFGAATFDTPSYLIKLNQLIEDLGISSRVKIIQSPSFEELKRILSECKVVIDSQREVSNTLTAIEAMASGNVVLIHRNSGCFKEVLKNGEIGFGFNDVKEGSKQLKQILEGIDDININNFIERSKDFSEDSFIKRLNSILLNHEERHIKNGV